ncbi:hypothetical protein ACG7TL_006008 [Trametes sanguinea]
MFSPHGSNYSYTSIAPRYSPRSSALATTHTERGTHVENDTITEGLCSDPLQVFDVDRDVDGTVPVQLRNLCTRGSYSWVEAPRPTILVPGTHPLNGLHRACCRIAHRYIPCNVWNTGSPRAWRDRAVPFRVAEDSGASIFDPSGHFMAPMSKLLPLFLAVDVMEEGSPAEARTDWGALDFVLDRSSMRKLLRWVRCADPKLPLGSARPPPFRLDLHLGGEKTVLVEPRSVGAYTKTGFRRNFDKTMTFPDAASAPSTKYHHRIVQYVSVRGLRYLPAMSLRDPLRHPQDLENLKLVVRFEVDAYAPEDGVLADMSAKLSLYPPAPPPAPATSTICSNAAVAVVRGGKFIPHSSLIEITTRSYKAQRKWYEIYPQLFLSQTPHFYLAVHDRGTFLQIAKHGPASPRLSPYENHERMQQSMRQLIHLLETVQEMVKQHGKQGVLSLVCRDGKLRAHC